MDISNFDRTRWVLYFEILGQVALAEPVPVSKVYERVVRESDRLDLKLTYSELVQILREFEQRGIVKLFNHNGTLHVVLTDKARYWLLVFSSAMSNL